MGEPTLTARDIELAFGEGEKHQVVLGPPGGAVSLDLYPGQLTLLMGPSGSGKSTLLAVLSGLQAPDRGTVHALGRDLYAMSELDRERFRLAHCGFVFQGFNLFPSLTIWQQLEMVVCWGQGLSARQARARVEAMLALLGLEGKGHLFPEGLSGGEKQRVAIGRALIKGPDMVFADEPTSALDWARGQQVVELFQAVARQGKTVLVVGHDARLLPYADRVLTLEDGRLGQQA